MRGGNPGAGRPLRRTRGATTGVGEQGAQREEDTSKRVGRWPAQKMSHAVLQGCVQSAVLRRIQLASWRGSRPFKAAAGGLIATIRRTDLG